LCTTSSFSILPFLHIVRRFGRGSLRIAGLAIEVAFHGPDPSISLLLHPIDIAGDVFGPEQLLIFRPEDAISLKAGPQGVRVMIFGGDSMGSKRHIWWNFVSSSKERIEQAKEEWKTGRFDIVPGDEEDFVPLPG